MAEIFFPEQKSWTQSMFPLSFHNHYRFRGKFLWHCVNIKRYPTAVSLLGFYFVISVPSQTRRSLRPSFIPGVWRGHVASRNKRLKTEATVQYQPLAGCCGHTWGRSRTLSGFLGDWMENESPASSDSFPTQIVHKEGCPDCVMLSWSCTLRQWVLNVHIDLVSTVIELPLSPAASKIMLSVFGKHFS